MKTYLEQEGGSLLEGGRSIPKGHRFYSQALIEQVVGDATIVPYEVIPISSDEKVALFKSAVQSHMDYVAKSSGYDVIFTSISYVTSTHATFGPEAIAFRDWRDTVWDICYSLLADWQNGGDEPTIDDVINGLPAYPG